MLHSDLLRHVRVVLVETHRGHSESGIAARGLSARVTGETMKTIRRYEARLRSAFRGALLTAATAPYILVVGCVRHVPGEAAEAGTTHDADGGSTADNDSGLDDATVQDDSPSSGVDDSGLNGACAPVFMADAGADASMTCTKYSTMPCGVPNSTPRGPNCLYPFNICAQACDGVAFNCHPYGDACLDGSVAAGPFIMDCVTCPGAAGRRPRRLAPPSFARGKSAVGDYFARVAHLEAASVHAFNQIEVMLTERGAPASLCRAARSAARDETRHARTVSRLARRFGGVPAAAHVKRRRARESLVSLAVENFVEGCVRETYGALVATWQAANSSDAAVAAVMTRIAADETRHAALSWSIAAWAETQLSPAARKRVMARGAAAVSDLLNETATPPTDVRRIAGLPDRATQCALLRELDRTLWSATAA